MASIQVKRAVSLVAAMFSLAGHAEERELTNFAGSDVQLLTECAQTQLGGNCTIYDARKSRRRKILSFPFSPTSIEYEDGVFVIRFPCGTACSATYFYRTTGAIGGPFPAILAYDTSRGVVLSLSGNVLRMYKMFSKEKFSSVGKINLNVEDGANLANAIGDVKLRGHTFWITYTNRNGEVVTALQAVPNIIDR